MLSWTTVVLHATAVRIQGSSTRGCTHPTDEEPSIQGCSSSDDHLYPLIVIGAAVAEDNVYGEKKAQTWELQNMCNNQFVWGSWDGVKVAACLD